MKPALEAQETDLTEYVGPVLEAGGDTIQAIIAAIRELNKGIVLQDRGSYVRILVCKSCLVTREAIERILGRSFSLPGDLEKVMPAFKGKLTVTEDMAIWSFGRMS